MEVYILWERPNLHKIYTVKNFYTQRPLDRGLYCSSTNTLNDYVGSCLLLLLHKVFSRTCSILRIKSYSYAGVNRNKEMSTTNRYSGLK